MLTMVLFQHTPLSLNRVAPASLDRSKARKVKVCTLSSWATIAPLSMASLLATVKTTEPGESKVLGEASLPRAARTRRAARTSSHDEKRCAKVSSSNGTNTLHNTTRTHNIAAQHAPQTHTHTHNIAKALPPTWNYCVTCLANNVDAMSDKNGELVFEH